LHTTRTRSQAKEDPNAMEREIINANGTLQSISKWGENNGLNTGQQTAFEILASVYVLSFYDKATAEGMRADTYDAFLDPDTPHSLPNSPPLFGVGSTTLPRTPSPLG
jgi:hypothetical protein